MDHAVAVAAAVVGQLPHDAAAVLGAGAELSADDGGAVDVALGVERDAAVGLAAVRAAREAVEHRLAPARGRLRELEHGAAVEVAALHGRAVQVAGGVRHHVGVGILAVVLAEVMDHADAVHRRDEAGKHADHREDRTRTEHRETDRRHRKLLRKRRARV